MDVFHAGRKRETLPRTEEPMTTVDFSIALFCRIDTHLHDIPKHPAARL